MEHGRRRNEARTDRSADQRTAGRHRGCVQGQLMGAGYEKTAMALWQRHERILCCFMRVVYVLCLTTSTAGVHTCTHHGSQAAHRMQLPHCASALCSCLGGLRFSFLLLQISASATLATVPYGYVCVDSRGTAPPCIQGPTKQSVNSDLS